MTNRETPPEEGTIRVPRKALTQAECRAGRLARMSDEFLISVPGLAGVPKQKTAGRGNRSEPSGDSLFPMIYVNFFQHQNQSILHFP